MDSFELAGLLRGRHIGKPRSFKGFSVDSRNLSKGQVFVAIKGKVHDGHDFTSEAVHKGAVAILCERELELDQEVAQIVVENSLQALRNLAFWKRENFKGKVIAIAGSAGKTTTKELVAFLLSKVGKVCKTPKNYNSQVGVPLSVVNFEEDCDFWVVEMGASQKGDVKSLVEMVKPHVRAITAIGEEHLETFGCLDDVVLGNGEVFHSMGEEDWGVCPYSVSHCYPIHRKLTFGKGGLRAEGIELSTEGIRFKVEGLSLFVPVPSLAIVENSLCAFSVLEALGLDWKPLAKHLSNFEPVEGRFRVFRKGGLTLIDDTYNANPLSVRMALRSLSLFGGYRVAVLGDMLELGQESEFYHREVGRLCKDLGIDLCLFYGSQMKDAYEECAKVGGCCIHFDNSRELLKALINIERATILFKGSRGMKMEKILEGLVNGYNY